jgi:hypothetical protein
MPGNLQNSVISYPSTLVVLFTATPLNFKFYLSLSQPDILHCAVTLQWLASYCTEFGFRSLNIFISIYLILPAALGPGVYSASNRNEYQKQKRNVSRE